MMCRSSAVFLTFWPLEGGGKLKENAIFQGYRKDIRLAPQWELQGQPWENWLWVWVTGSVEL